VDSILVDSVLVIPWPFWNPPEFRGMEITILAGSTAKIPFRRIPGIDQIPPVEDCKELGGTVMAISLLGGIVIGAVSSSLGGIVVIGRTFIVG
jgi:hypothetical protein